MDMEYRCDCSDRSTTSAENGKIWRQGRRYYAVTSEGFGYDCGLREEPEARPEAFGAAQIDNVYWGMAW